MNLYFLCPSNTRFMPYLSYYDNEIDSNIEKKYIIWDRFSNEEKNSNKLIYKDGLKGHKRGVFSYLKYMSFLYRKLLRFESQEDKIVIFGFQTTFFLTPYLFFSKSRYVIDIRDYHYLFRLTPSFIFKKADFIAVSSPGYCELFNENVNCIICHNLYDYGIDLDTYSNYYKKPINISYMGAIRDIDSQKTLINGLANKNDFIISFHGVGDIVPELKDYILKEDIANVDFTGRYDKNDESFFYKKASIVNMLRDNKSYNDRVALPNRLYSAAFFQRPSLCYEGTTLAKLVKEYSLGLCLSYEDNIEESLLNYFETFSYNNFKYSCNRFLEVIRKDQKLFQRKLSSFIVR